MRAMLCRVLGATAIAGLPVVAAAQIGLPPLPDTRGTLDGALGQVRDIADIDLLQPGEIARQLANARLDRLALLVRRNRDRLEFDAQGAPALRGVLLATGVTAAERARATDAGFRVLDEETIEGLDLALVRFAVPDGQSLRKAERTLAALMPMAEIAPDNLYFTSASPAPALPVASSVATSAGPGSGARIGLIDSGVGTVPGVAGGVTRKGFARGAPRAADHGTAVAALALRTAGSGTTLLAADVYGDDPAGGNASAIARALGWLIAQGAAVINISLTGPDNALVRAAITRAQGKGAIIVAAVGNDGPAAPPAFPAAQPGVLGITGVDGNGRALPEAGRGRHVAFAAPGRDLAAPGGDGRIRRWRGTSFASPLVAGLLARAYPAPGQARIVPAVRTLTEAARDLGRKGRDPVFGHGLVCGDCAR